MRNCVLNWLRIIKKPQCKHTILTYNNKKSPRQSRGVLKISPLNLCIYGGTNPPHPQFYALKGGELNPKRLKGKYYGNRRVVKGKKI
jgi:hypothetical protein